MLYMTLLCLIAIHFAIMSTVSGHTNSTPMTWANTLLPMLDAERPTIYIDAVIKIDIDKVLEGQSQSQCQSRDQSQDQGSTSNSRSDSTFRNSGHVHESTSTARLSSRTRTAARDSSSTHSASDDKQHQTEQSLLPSQGLPSQPAPESGSQMTATTTSSAEIPADTSQRHSSIGELHSSGFLETVGTAFPWPSMAPIMGNSTHHGNQSPSASRMPNLSIFTGLGPPLVAELPRHIIVLLATVPLILMIIV